MQTEALPECDWVYFAAPSKGSWTVTGKFVEEEKIIIRNVHNKLGQRLANNSNLRPGHKILLVYGGDGRPYRALFCCAIVASANPIKTPRPSFGIFLEIDKSMYAHLKESDYEVDPVLNKFTGISIADVRDLRHITCPIPKPAGRNTLRHWKDVPWVST
jgi:hypothetical protein